MIAPPTRHSRGRSAAASVLLFALNLLIVWRLLRFDYINNMGSIEGAYFAIGRHIVASFPDLSWWPAWYGGIPFSYSYPPLLHYLVALVAAVFPVSVPRAHHIVVGCFYSLGPVTLFWLAARLCGSLRAAFAAALLYSFSAPTAYVMPSVLRDLGNPLLPERLQNLVIYGDNGHISALALAPLALLLFDIALARNRPLNYVLAALSFALLPLTNWLGAMALALLLFSYLLARTPIRRPLGAAHLWLKALATGIAAYAFASPILTPSFIRTIQFNSQTLEGDFRLSSHNLLVAAPYLLLTLLVLKAVSGQLGVPTHTQFALFFVTLTGAVCMPLEWFKLPLVPQPQRYHLELDLGLALLVALPLAMWLNALPRLWKLVCVALAAVLCFLEFGLYRQFARDHIRPVDITGELEYKTAKWFERNLPGERVMAFGSQAIFLNAFGDSPQHAGGFEPANPNWQNRVAQYIVSTVGGAGARDAEVTLCWLKAFGIRAIAVNGPHSRNPYPQFQRIERFDQIATLAWRQGDDSIYTIPLRNKSLAHAVTPLDLVRTPPYDGLDTAQVSAYVEAIDNAANPEVAFRWTSQHSAELTGILRPGHVLATQITFFPGWKATLRGQPLRTFKDGLGLLVIDPHCDGACPVQLNYGGGPEVHAGMAFASIAFTLSVLWVVGDMRRRRSSPHLPLHPNSPFT